MTRREIFKTYNGNVSNVNKSAEIIHDYIFSRGKANISKYGQREADILTKFFQELKQISFSSSKNKNNLKLELLKNEIEDLSILKKLINFKISGTAFEDEIANLFIKEAEDCFDQSISGTQSAGAYIKLDSRNAQSAIKEIAEIFNYSIKRATEAFEKRVVQGNFFGENENPQDLYLRVGMRRAGKIDFYSGEGKQLSFELSSEPKGDLKKALDLLKTATFSIKSYATSTNIELGKTTKRKAITAVSQFVAQKYNNDAKYAGYYYLAHPEKDKKETEKYRSKDLKNLYEHYNHMHQAYELTGMGLRYQNFDDFINVDFLLVNRAGSDDIKVYSAKQLLKDFGKNNKFNID